MSSLEALETSIKFLLTELRSDKVAGRQKAFNKLDNILNNRKDELESLFKDSNLNWNDLLQSAHEGLLHQAKKLSGTEIQNENDPKITLYAIVVQKIIKYGNESRLI